MNIALYAILFSILPGYWFLTRWYITRYKIIQESGYHVLFQSMVAGLVIFIVATILVSIGENYEFELVKIEWFPSDYQIWLSSDYVSTLTISIFIALVSAEIFNFFLDQDKVTKNSAERNNDVIKLLMIEAIEQAIPLEFTLKNDKCYIGLIMRSEMIRQQESDIAIVPILSGYRDSTTREIVISTDYLPTIKKFIDIDPEKYNHDNFRVIIRMSDIATARLFHPEVYEEFQKSEIEKIY